VTLASYRYRDGAPGPNQFDTSQPQTLFASVSGTGPTWEVALPDCYWQADLVQSDALPTIDQDHRYSPSGRLISVLHGGSGVCKAAVDSVTITPTTTPTTLGPTTPDSGGVEGTSTPVETNSTPSVAVLGESFTRAPVVAGAPQAVAARALPRTGSAPKGELLAAGLLLGGGSILVAVARRRARPVG
jgi:LPXTG-motif cell wall-anchored protein